MNIQTHTNINEALCGSALSLAPGRAVVRMQTTPAMGADALNLVHGGFIFGMADYAAMLAVNDPNVVLGSADTRFLKPVVVGETVQATAEVLEEAGKKRIVAVSITRDGTEVMSGTFVCFVLPKHVLAM